MPPRAIDTTETGGNPLAMLELVGQLTSRAYRPPRRRRIQR